MQTITMVVKMAHTTLNKKVIAMETIMAQTALVTHGEEIQKEIITINLLMELITHILTTMLMVATKATQTIMVMKQHTVEIAKVTTTPKLKTTPST